MAKYFIIYNDKANIDVNLHVRTRVPKPSPNREYEEIPVPGHEKLYKDKGYGDIDISIPFNFASKYQDEWDNDFRRIKKWLHSKGNNKLQFSDDIQYFYRVNKITIDTPERLLKKIGKFNVTFTCEPYCYLSEGLNEIDIASTIDNAYELSKPTYLITGEGLLTMNVNGKKIKANVGQKLIIDTNLGLCFREGGSQSNVALSGKYKDLYLKEGENTFEWSSGFDIKIIPNWRCV